MNRRFLQTLAAAAAVAAFGASPALAAAKKHPHPPPPPSAYDVYTQQVPTAKGPKPVGGPGSGVSSTQSGQSGQYVPSVPLSSNAATNLKRQGGRDKRVLKSIATSPALGVQKVTAAAGPTSVRSPSALGAAVGLGSGPIALFAALIVGAILLFWLGRMSGRRAERR